MHEDRQIVAFLQQASINKLISQRCEIRVFVFVTSSEDKNHIQPIVAIQPTHQSNPSVVRAIQPKALASQREVGRTLNLCTLSDLSGSQS